MRNPKSLWDAISRGTYLPENRGERIRPGYYRDSFPGAPCPPPPSQARFESWCPTTVCSDEDFVVETALEVEKRWAEEKAAKRGVPLGKGPGQGSQKLAQQKVISESDLASRKEKAPAKKGSAPPPPAKKAAALGPAPSTAMKRSSQPSAEPTKKKARLESLPAEAPARTSAVLVPSGSPAPQPPRQQAQPAPSPAISPVPSPQKIRPEGTTLPLPSWSFDDSDIMGGVGRANQLMRELEAEIPGLFAPVPAPTAFTAAAAVDQGVSLPEDPDTPSPLALWGPSGLIQQLTSSEFFDEIGDDLPLPQSSAAPTEAVGEVSPRRASPISISSSSEPLAEASAPVQIPGGQDEGRAAGPSHSQTSAPSVGQWGRWGSALPSNPPASFHHSADSWFINQVLQAAGEAGLVPTENQWEDALYDAERLHQENEDLRDQVDALSERNLALQAERDAALRSAAKSQRVLEATLKGREETSATHKALEAALREKEEALQAALKEKTEALQSREAVAREKAALTQVLYSRVEQTQEALYRLARLEEKLAEQEELFEDFMSDFHQKDAEVKRMWSEVVASEQSAAKTRDELRQSDKAVATLQIVVRNLGSRLSEMTSAQALLQRRVQEQAESIGSFRSSYLALRENKHLADKSLRTTATLIKEKDQQAQEIKRLLSRLQQMRDNVLTVKTEYKKDVELACKIACYHAYPEGFDWRKVEAELWKHDSHPKVLALMREDLLKQRAAAHAPGQSSAPK